jgi:hypothetical protein
MVEDFCPYCGTEMAGDDDTAVCQGCGYSLDMDGPDGEDYFEDVGGEG